MGSFCSILRILRRAVAVTLRAGICVIVLQIAHNATCQILPQTTPGLTAPQEFEVVSVKLIDARVQGEHYSENNDPGRLSMVATTHKLVVRAYEISDQQLSGEPAWFSSHLYRVDAVTGGPVSETQMGKLLRIMLEDRFQLKLRQEERDLRVYLLEVLPGGPKFKQLQPDEKPAAVDPPPNGYFQRRFSTMTQLVNLLNHTNGGIFQLDRLVVDNTGLNGNYDMKLLTAMEAQTDDQVRRSVQFPNLFQDIQSQLGLRVVSRSVKTPYYVVERSAQPPEN